MKALVYGVAPVLIFELDSSPEPFEVPEGANTLTVNLARTPTDLRKVPDPQLPHKDWVITRPRLTGICGSDSKQILMDFGEGDADNAMGGFCSFPQVMGHEVVADVVARAPRPAGYRWGSGLCSIRGCRVRRVALNRHVLPAKAATTACAGASPTATSGRASTPGCPPTQWRDAFLAIANQADSGAVKVAIDQR
jgi:hypothetical protein